MANKPAASVTRKRGRPARAETANKKTKPATGGTREVSDAEFDRAIATLCNGGRALDAAIQRFEARRGFAASELAAVDKRIAILRSLRSIESPEDIPREVETPKTMTAGG